MARRATNANRHRTVAQPKPGSLAQREMAQAIAERIMALDRVIIASEMAMSENVAGLPEDDT